VVDVVPAGVVVEYVVAAGVVVTTVGCVGRVSTVLVLTLHAPSKQATKVISTIRVIASTPCVF